jgi:hypothetical protein
MRCLGCGEEMAVTAIVPDRALASFEHRTFTCAPCGATERRLVLSRDQPAPPSPQPEASSAATTPGADDQAPAEAESAAVSVPPLPQEAEHEGPVHEEPVPILVPATAWTRAVEKLRHRQADLGLRAEQVQKESWNSRFDKAWQRLAPDYPRSAQTHGANQKLRRRSWSPQASARIVIPRRRPVVEAPVIESSPEQIQKFNEFWDSLLPRQLPPPVSDGSPLAPLPRSVSLVPIESAQAASTATRAILLLRGTHSGRIAA